MRSREKATSRGGGGSEIGHRALQCVRRAFQFLRIVGLDGRFQPRQQLRTVFVENPGQLLKELRVAVHPFEQVFPVQNLATFFVLAWLPPGSIGTFEP